MERAEKEEERLGRQLLEVDRDPLLHSRRWYTFRKIADDTYMYRRKAVWYAGKPGGDLTDMIMLNNDNNKHYLSDEKRSRR